MERPFNFVCIALICEYVSGEIRKIDERNKLQLLAIQPAELRQRSQCDRQLDERPVVTVWTCSQHLETHPKAACTDAGGEGAGREGGGCEGGEEPRECKPVTAEAVGGQARVEKNFPWLSMRLQLAGSTNRLCSSRSSPPR
jgi:hypothetical protein